MENQLISTSLLLSVIEDDNIAVLDFNLSGNKKKTFQLPIDTLQFILEAYLSEKTNLKASITSS